MVLQPQPVCGIPVPSPAFPAGDVGGEELVEGRVGAARPAGSERLDPADLKGGGREPAGGCLGGESRSRGAAGLP